MGKNNYIWIFGENHGATTNNNSYFFWKHAVNIKDDIDVISSFNYDEYVKIINNIDFSNYCVFYRKNK